MTSQPVCDEPCRCPACWADHKRSNSIKGLQDMLGSNRSALDGLNAFSDDMQRRTGESPKCVRAAMQNHSTRCSTQGEKSATVLDPFLTLRSPRASCSPYIETCDIDMNAVITESLVVATTGSALAGVAEMIMPEDPAPKPHICLSAKGLTDNDAQMIVKLMDAGTVQRLVLAKNKLGDAAAVMIAEALKRNESLTFLSLAGNNVGEAGGIALAEALSVNTSLKSLFMSSNALGPTATQALHRANEERSTPLTGLCGLVLGTPVA